MSGQIKKAALTGGITERSYIMNNEDKILAILAEMKEDLAAVKATQVKQGEQLATQGEQLAEVKAAQTAQSEQLAEVTATQAIQQSQLDKLVEMQDELRTAVNRVAMAQEQDMLPYIKLLDEGHHDIMRQLVTKERVEVLEKDMRIVKGAVKKHTQQIAALGKAN